MPAVFTGFHHDTDSPTNGVGKVALASDALDASSRARSRCLQRDDADRRAAPHRSCPIGRWGVRFKLSARHPSRDHARRRLLRPPHTHAIGRWYRDRSARGRQGRRQIRGILDLYKSAIFWIQYKSAVPKPPHVQSVRNRQDRRYLMSGGTCGENAGSSSAGILSRREKLAPPLWNDRCLHDLALVGGKELQADLATLRALWISLVVGVHLLDLVTFAYFLFPSYRRRGAARCQNANGQTPSLQQCAARYPLSHLFTRSGLRGGAADRIALARAGAHFATSCSFAFDTCQRTMW